MPGVGAHAFSTGAEPDSFGPAEDACELNRAHRLRGTAPRSRVPKARWWPIRDLINGLLDRWAGWGLHYGPAGMISFQFDADPVGVIGGLVVLFITVGLVCSPQIVLLVVQRHVLGLYPRKARTAVYWVATVAGLLTAGTAAIGWLDAGRGDMVLDAAWAMSAVSFVGAIVATAWQRLGDLIVRTNPAVVVLVAVAVSVVLGMTLVPLTQ